MTGTDRIAIGVRSHVEMEDVGLVPEEHFTFTVNMTEEQAADMAQMQAAYDCMMFDLGHLSLFREQEPFTEEEQRTGYRIRQHGDHEHKTAVLWRAEEERKAADAKREAEMAACPYVACECGHHEDYC